MADILADIQKAEEERSIGSVKLVDGKLVAYYEVNEKDENDEWDYTRYQKIFDTWEQFVAYSQAFFNLQ